VVGEGKVVGALRERGRMREESRGLEGKWMLQRWEGEKLINIVMDVSFSEKCKKGKQKLWRKEKNKRGEICRMELRSLIGRYSEVWNRYVPRVSGRLCYG
jgi:hypothetical protein